MRLRAAVRCRAPKEGEPCPAIVPFLYWSWRSSSSPPVAAALRALRHHPNPRRNNALAVAGGSGPAGATATACTNGIQAAALVINAEGGILGHKVQFKIYDDQGITPQGVSLLSQVLIRHRYSRHTCHEGRICG